MRVKLQKAKRTLDNMKKREADAIAAKEAAEAKAVTLQAQADKAGYLLVSYTYFIVGKNGKQCQIPTACSWAQGIADETGRSRLDVATLLAVASRQRACRSTA